MIWKPAKHKSGYPLDLDAGERFTRFSQTFSEFPYPSIIGCVSGFLPQQDIFLKNKRLGQYPSGPNITTVPVNLQWQTVFPTLAKTG